MIKVSTSGDFANISKFLNKLDPKYIFRRLDYYGQRGVEALASATPKDSGKTAESWSYKVYVGTLLPIGGWRTYAPFRDEMRNAYNEWIRTTDLIDGVVDFDKAVRDPEKPNTFLPKYDSGDHLHPSPAGYKAMADAVLKEILEG